MFRLWNLFHGTEPSTENDIRAEIIWHNKWITCEGDTLCWNAWKKKGINTIDDLSNNEEGRLYSHSELTQRYKVRCTFLDALKIRLSIPLHWRSSITQGWQSLVVLSAVTGNVISLPGEDPKDVALINSRSAYTALISNGGATSTAYARWMEEEEDILRINSVDEWRDICTNSFRTVRETCIQSLQYKILDRILPCNKYLKQLRIRDTDTCSYCSQIDSIPHFLFNCPGVQSFWSNICDWFEKNMDIRMKAITLRDFICGVNPNYNKHKIIGFVILLAKHFIHRQKLFHQGKLALLHFLQELKAKLQCEKFILRQTGKATKFKKWEPLLIALG